MARDIAQIIAEARSEGAFDRLAGNRFSQFGTPRRRYLGPTLLPERNVDRNIYREGKIRSRTVIANAGTRYSASQKRGNMFIGRFLVELGYSDIRFDLTAELLDAINTLLDSNLEEDAMVRAMNLFDQMVLEPLRVHNEKNRMDALLKSQVELIGDEGYYELVQLFSPAGHRTNAGGQWSDDDYDPFDDIFGKVDLEASKGITVSRVITARTVLTIMAKNAKVKARVGGAVLTQDGQLIGLGGRASLARINEALTDDGLPPLELYDLKYNTEEDSDFFFDRASMLFVGETNEQEVINQGDEQRVVENTLGYTAIGKPAGKSTPGPKTFVEYKESKPPAVRMEAWQASFPVVTNPDAVAVIAGIN